MLQARTPLALKNYGPGQLATIALRGTSAQHTAVLWNGLNIMLPTLGQSDFALLSVGATTRVGVQPGPAAALYGSGAVGGAVLLTPTPTGGPACAAAPSSMRAASGWGAAAWRPARPRPTVAVRVAASYRQARNNYTYSLKEARGPVRYTLQNAALRHQWSISPDAGLARGRGGRNHGRRLAHRSDREIQPGVNVLGGDARERDQSRRLVLGYRHVAARAAVGRARRLV